MASIGPDMSLDPKLSATRTVGGFLREASAMGDVEARVAKLEEFVRVLEEEKRKIEAFKRELPLCMILVTDVIGGLKEELEQCRGDRYNREVEEFMPMKRSKLEEEMEERAKLELDSKDKMNWMSSAQLWSDNYSDNDKTKTSEERTEKQSGLDLEPKNKNREGTFAPFNGVSPAKKNEKPTGALPDLSLLSPAVKCSRPVAMMQVDHLYGGANSGGRAPTSTGLSLQAQQQPARKARRCWSPELHRRFVFSLQQLGGAQVATPKQIRELMKVEGLTNDEVKSHLQKYRLHARRAPNSSVQVNQPVLVMGSLWPSQDHYAAPSGSPQSPLQLADVSRAISVTAGDSYEDEDVKSESYGWK